MNHLSAVRINDKEIAGYGSMITDPPYEPMADGPEFTYFGRTQLIEIPGRVSTGILKCKLRDFIVSQLERHIETPEVLTAISGNSVIVMAKPDDVSGEFSSLRAFRIPQGSSFVMKKGTWHWIPFPISDDESVFQVMFAENTEENDLETVQLPAPLRIEP